MGRSWLTATVRHCWKLFLQVSFCAVSKTTPHPTPTRPLPASLGRYGKKCAPCRKQRFSVWEACFRFYTHRIPHTPSSWSHLTFSLSWSHYTRHDFPIRCFSVVYAVVFYNPLPVFQAALFIIAATRGALTRSPPSQRVLKTLGTVLESICGSFIHHYMGFIHHIMHWFMHRCFAGLYTIYSLVYTRFYSLFYTWFYAVLYTILSSYTRFYALL